jgi:hypothetical protein
MFGDSLNGKPRRSKQVAHGVEIGDRGTPDGG